MFPVEGRYTTTNEGNMKTAYLTFVLVTFQLSLTRTTVGAELDSESLAVIPGGVTATSSPSPSSSPDVQRGAEEVTPDDRLRDHSGWRHSSRPSHSGIWDWDIYNS